MVSVWDERSLFAASAALPNDKRLDPQLSLAVYERIVARLAAGRLEVDSVEPVQPSLEDVFLDVVEKAGRG